MNNVEYPEIERIIYVFNLVYMVHNTKSVNF